MRGDVWKMGLIWLCLAYIDVEGSLFQHTITNYPSKIVKCHAHIATTHLYPTWKLHSNGCKHGIECPLGTMICKVQNYVRLQLCLKKDVLNSI